MQDPACEIVYRPLLLPLLTLLAVIWLTVCRGAEASTLFLIPVALFVVYGYFLFRLRVEICFRSFLLLFLLSLLLGGMVFGKLERRRADFNAVLVQLAQFPASERLFGRVVAFPQSIKTGWRLCLKPLWGRFAGRGEIELFLPASAYDDPRLPLIGDLVSAEVALKTSSAPRHPFLKRIQNSGVSGVVAGGRLESLEDLLLVARFPGILGRVDRSRRFFYRAFLTAGGDNAEVGIILAVLIGCRDRLPDKVRHLFLDFGIFHLFAISGLHLGIVAGLIFFLGKTLLSLGGGQATVIGTLNGAAGLTLFFIPFYLLLTGLHLPVMRAGIMAGCFLAALLSRRLRDPFSALIGAAIVILFCWPQALFEISFQLSFIAVAALLWSLPQSRRCWSSVFSNACRRHLSASWENGLQSCFSLGFSSLAISLATAPLLVNQVHFLSLYALPANLVLVPLFSLLILPLGMLCLFLVGFPALLTQVLPLLGLLLKIMLAVLFRLHESLPSGRCYLSELTGYETLFWGGLLL
ncbi:MAG: ComEC/Rec2 family competence protein, partial [Deltaproteobacteria bacterium]|nr:ComEC/Rec2 family competence protein [Deltaproteobacteria bacterium]